MKPKIKKIIWKTIVAFGVFIMVFLTVAPALQ